LTVIDFRFLNNEAIILFTSLQGLNFKALKVMNFMALFRMLFAYLLFVFPLSSSFPQSSSAAFLNAFPLTSP